MICRDHRVDAEDHYPPAVGNDLRRWTGGVWVPVRRGDETDRHPAVEDGLTQSDCRADGRSRGHRADESDPRPAGDDRSHSDSTVAGRYRGPRVEEVDLPPVEDDGRRRSAGRRDDWPYWRRVYRVNQSDSTGHRVRHCWPDSREQTIPRYLAEDLGGWYCFQNDTVVGCVRGRANACCSL